MAMAAQGLPVVPVPEQRLVAPVRGDVIHHRSHSATQGAGRVQVQELGTGLFPLALVATLAAARAGGIIARAVLAICQAQGLPAGTNPATVVF